jgi:general secretion pathway protein B
MSFILDALKRSENERQRTVGPSLADAPMRRLRPERPWWAVAVAALLVVNLGVLIVVLTRNHSTPQAAAVAVNPPPQVAPALAPPVPAPSMQQATQPAIEPAEPVMPSPAATRPSTNPAVRSLAEEAATSNGIDPLMSAGMAAAAAVPAGPPAVRPIQPPAVAPLPSTATFNSVAAANSAQNNHSGNVASRNEEVLPTATDLAASGTNIPELKLDIHVFSANPAERFVFVNMRKYLEGQTLPEGPIVEKITTDGVILNQRGLRYVLPRQ